MADGVDVGLIRVTHIDAEEGTAFVGADVFSEHRGKGYGSDVFEAAMGEAITLGATKKLYLKVFVDNERAVHIYTCAGFTIDQDYPVDFLFRLGSPRAYVLMQKDLFS